MIRDTNACPALLHLVDSPGLEPLHNRSLSIALHCPSRAQLLVLVVFGGFEATIGLR